MVRVVPLFILLALLLSAAVVPLRAQEATVEAPYREQAVTFASGDVTLAGTLTLPEGDGPFPAVALVSGSGPSDRDESLAPLTALKPFAVLADALARAGIAVLRYDDRGVGGSTGDHAAATGLELASDAAAAVAFLRQHEAIDPARVGLLGHSEGGALIADVAADDPDLAFVISLAGTSVPGSDVVVVQSEAVLKASGAPQDVIDAQVAQARRIVELIAAEDWEGLEADLRTQLEQQLAALPEAQREALGDPEVIIAQTMATYRHWMAYFLAHDPGEDWKRVTAPVLAVFGELDKQVLPEQNIPPLEAALAEAGNEDVTIVEIPGANHLFQAATTGSPNEYATLAPAFTDALIPAIVEWLSARVGQ